MTQTLTIQLATVQVGRQTAQPVATVATAQALLLRLRARATSLTKRLDNFDPDTSISQTQIKMLSLLLSDIENVEDILSEYMVAETIGPTTVKQPTVNRETIQQPLLTIANKTTTEVVDEQPNIPAAAKSRSNEVVPSKQTALAPDDSPIEEPNPTEMPVSVSYTVQPGVIFEDDEEARKFFESIRWPNGTQCPACANHKCYYSRGTGSYRCDKCRQSFNVRSDTPMYKTKLNYTSWAVLMAESARELVKSDITSLARRLGINTAAVTETLKRLKDSAGPPWFERLLERIIRIKHDPDQKIKPLDL